MGRWSKTLSGSSLRLVGGCAVELPEEDIVHELNGRYAAWKVCDGLVRLREQGVTVSVSRVHNTFVRRCWQIDPGSWSRIQLADPMGILSYLRL